MPSGVQKRQGSGLTTGRASSESHNWQLVTVLSDSYDLQTSLLSLNAARI